MSTIAAISTPHGVGGIAVVRLSGADAFTIAAKHLQLPRNGRDMGFSLFRRNDDVLDEVVVSLFHAPHSYTGEDVVEISCHGSLYVQQAILQALLDSGARLAEPGEFTRRAFLNGKLNLSQAEAVADLIDSTNAAAHSLAVSQLRGGYAKELETLRQQLVDLTALLELELDFSDEDVEFADRSSLHSLASQIYHDSRAIVSDIPGTTRDTIEETFVIEGTPFRIIDTAGLRHSDDPIEHLGIQRTIATVVQADIILYVLDSTQPFAQALDDLQELQDIRTFKDKHLFIVNNKIDLVPETLTAPYRTFPISAKEGTGLDALTSALAKAAQTDLAQAPDVMLTNVRHYDALGHVEQALLHVAKGLADQLPADLVVIDLRDALHHLGTITGQVTSDEVLGTIFSRFCIGK